MDTVTNTTNQGANNDVAQLVPVDAEIDPRELVAWLVRMDQRLADLHEWLTEMADDRAEGIA
jgi:hypothetical protein